MPTLRTRVEDGKFWLAEVAVLDAMTHGRSEREALLTSKRAATTARDRLVLAIPEDIIRRRGGG